MSNDLISRKKAIFFVRSVFDRFGINAGHKSRADYLIKTLKNMPTAYDVDKIVERLKELKTYKLNMEDAMSEIMHRGGLGTYVCLEDVVEIVKSGGIE